MAIERTLSIIKPDATRRNLTGQINARLEAGGLRIVAQRRIRLSRAQAEAFYAVHRERPFYRSLCEFMTSGPVVVQVLEGENAIEGKREVMGATDPPQERSPSSSPRSTSSGERAPAMPVDPVTWHPPEAMSET
jgi:nucleoside-diphosphate kinase